MFIYFLLGLALLVGGALGMVEGRAGRSGGIFLISFIVTALGAIVCLAVLFY